MAASFLVKNERKKKREIQRQKERKEEKQKNKKRIKKEKRGEGERKEEEEAGARRGCLGSHISPLGAPGSEEAGPHFSCVTKFIIFCADTYSCTPPGQCWAWLHLGLVTRKTVTAMDPGESG